MKVIHKDFRVSTKNRNQMIDITSEVRSHVIKSGIADGDVIVFCPHTTAAITINENADPSVPHDVLLTLEELLPKHRPGYQHYEGNSDSHCKSSMVGCSEQVMIKGKSLNLGTWQAIFFCEFDGPRNRTVLLQIRGE
ncbi:MAG: secondary thiamine-phosphate synthase enzyme YjbQ [Phycisphaerales bacterium]|jgi:secondary thiamine-phosphate synthase enzyme